MNRPPLSTPGPGDMIPLDRVTWRALIEAGRTAARERLGFDAPELPSDPTVPACVVLVQNNTGSNLSAFSVVSLTTAPTATGPDYPHVLRELPLFGGTVPVGPTDCFAILIDPANSSFPGNFARAVVMGVVPCSVLMNTPGDQYAAPKASTTAELSSQTNNGPARILWVAGSSGVQSALVLIQEWAGVLPVNSSPGAPAANIVPSFASPPTALQATPFSIVTVGGVTTYTFLSQVGANSTTTPVQQWVVNGSTNTFIATLQPSGTTGPTTYSLTLTSTQVTEQYTFSNLVTPVQLVVKAPASDTFTYTLVTGPGNTPFYVLTQVTDNSGNPTLFTISVQQVTGPTLLQSFSSPSSTTFTQVTGGNDGTTGQSYLFTISGNQHVTGMSDGPNLWNGSSAVLSQLAYSVASAIVTATYPSNRVEDMSGASAVRVPTVSSADNSTNAASTAMVQGAVSAGGGGRTAASYTAAGTTQGTATAITTDAALVSSVPVANNGVICPNKVGAIINIHNADPSNNLKVYPPVGAAFNGAPVNAAQIVVPGSMFQACYISSTQWN